MSREELYSTLILEPGSGCYLSTLFRIDGGYVHARQPRRKGKNKRLTDDMLTPVPLANFHPVAPARLARFDGDLDAADVFVKRPRWDDWVPASGDTFARLLAREGEVLQAIGDRPHPNLACFLGYVPYGDGDRIAGFVFKRYPRSLNSVVRDAHAVAKLDAAAVLADIQAAVDHLHTLGFAHNDVSLGNVMLDDAGRAILIDFDAALPLGTPLSHKYGTRGFFDAGPAPLTSANTTPQLGYDADSADDSLSSTRSSSSRPHRELRRARLSCVENDAYALAQLRPYLDGTHDFKVDEAADEEEAEAARRALQQALRTLCEERLRSGEWDDETYQRGMALVPLA